MRLCNMECQKKLFGGIEMAGSPGILRLGRYRPDLDVVNENELVQHI